MTDGECPLSLTAMVVGRPASMGEDFAEKEKSQMF